MGMSVWAPSSPISHDSVADVRPGAKGSAFLLLFQWLVSCNVGGGRSIDVLEVRVADLCGRLCLSSPTSSVAVVLTAFFDHMDDKGRSDGHPSKTVVFNGGPSLI